MAVVRIHTHDYSGFEIVGPWHVIKHSYKKRRWLVAGYRKGVSATMHCEKAYLYETAKNPMHAHKGWPTKRAALAWLAANSAKLDDPAKGAIAKSDVYQYAHAAD